MTCVQDSGHLKAAKNARGGAKPKKKTVIIKGK